MKWVGLTGNLGSGKSTVAKIVRDFGFPVLDADEAARLALGPGSPILVDVKKKFGSEVFLADGSLDRKALGRRVFRSKEDLNWLESKVHPEVQRQIAEKRQALESSGHSVAFYDVPLLFEKGLAKAFDQVIVVTAPAFHRKQRVLSRDGISESDFVQRSLNQWPMEKKEKLADVVISNDGSVEDLKIKVQDFLKTLVED
ncbi:MAG: dephospho-CoA kinase [Bdellovibrionales bacterium]|nr:dephospho-CoA kinase [Bdellovibrionales bacterium]